MASSPKPSHSKREESRLESLSRNPTEYYQTASESSVSLEMLHIIVTGSNQLLTSLLVVLHDISLIREGKNLVFPIDFYELHTFLWPEQRHSQSRQVTRALLQSNDIEFTLLPGTTVEFIDHLKRVVSTNRAAQTIFDRMLHKPFVHALLRYFNESDHPSSQQKEVINAVSQVNDDLRGLTNLGSALGRLEHLYKMENLKSLDRFLDAEDSGLQPHLDTLRDVELTLALRRPTARSNFIDAHNYALTWALCDAHWARKKTIYYIVTSSPHTFHAYRNFKWSRFPHQVADPTHPEASLVRHPIQVLYLARMLKLEGYGWKELKETTESLTKLLVAWRSIPAYRSFLEDQEKPTTVVKLPTNHKYLKAFVDFRGKFDALFAPVRTVIESDIISEENFRRERGVNPFAIGARSGSLSDPLQFTSTRLVYSLFDKLTLLTVRTIGKLRENLQTIPSALVQQIDTRGVVTNAKRLTLKHEHDKVFNSIEIKVSDKVTGDVVLAGDIYQDYYALWWTAGVNFVGFLQEVSRFIATAKPFISKRHRKRRLKEYDGVYIFCFEGEEPTRIPFDVVPDLDPDSLIEAAKGRRIIMIRIATTLGDFCYDFEAFRGLPQRVGIISHLPIETPVSWLIEVTNQRPMPTLELRRIVKRCLNLKKEFKSEAIA